MKKVLLIIITVFLVVSTLGCENSKFIRSGKISCIQKEKIMNYESIKIIDVRTQEEYNERHLDNAINIPYESIVDKLKEDSSINKDTPIIVYCRSGNRSSQAYNSLKNDGYNHIYDLGSIESCA